MTGQVEIGDEVLLGAGAVLMPGLSIGAGARVELGSVVRDDVEPGTLVAGNPARPVESG